MLETSEPQPGLSAGESREGDGTALHELRVLVVEDEPGIRDFLARGLANAGFLTTSAADGHSGERLALAETFDAIVLDLMLPGRSGLEVLAAVRESKPNVPVLVLTARGSVADRVGALEAGAIDYLVKPFAMQELVARLRAQLRASARVSETVVRAAGIEADLVTRRVLREGMPVNLSSTEFDLVLYLLRHRGSVLSRQQILSSVWGYTHETATNNVDVYIGYLRKKLALPGNPAPIHTVRGVGYRLGDAG
jgi:two-component system copper resistance phosphate regulon response regulator CusR